MKPEHSRLRELVEEFRQVVAGQRTWGDAVLPPLAFVLINLLVGVWPAIAASAGLSLVLALMRLVRGKSPRYALGGLGAVTVAALLAIALNRAEGYFLPGMLSGAATALACLISVVLRRPLVAWTSFIARRWPLSWYWHPRVRPAYSEVTLLWFLFFSGRLLVQLVLFQRGATLALSTVNLLLGWPSLVLLLAASYLYGLWRLRRLAGPSVEEFKRDTSPPWKGQRRGF